VTTDEDKALVPLLAGPAAHGRAWVAFGDIPQDRLAALREAYAKTLVDPAYVAEAKQRGLILEPVNAEKQMELARAILATPDAPVERLKKILGM
jgi:hypothetical protein